MIDLCIDNLNNGGYTSGTSVPNKIPAGLVLMTEQRIEKHTLNSVLKISKKGTLLSPTKSTPFHYVLINSIFFKTVKNLRYSSIMVPSIFTPNHSVYLSDLRKPTLFPLKCHFSALNDDSAAHCPA